MPRRLSIASAAVVLGLFAIMAAPVAAAGGTVNVYYAASLKALNENSVGPAFQSQAGYTYQGFPNNSGLIVSELKAHLINPDVVEFADAGLNSQLMGSANGNIVKWYITFARTHLVIGFNPKSKFAPMFRKVQQHKLAWYKPLLAKGLKFGRTDPNSDPKGYRVIFSFKLAERLFGLKKFSRRVLGPIKNPDPTGSNSLSPQVFPEATLVSQLTSGNLDAGVFYLPEAIAAHVPFIGLPQSISFGSPRYAKLDATQHYTNSKGIRITGSPTFYTISIPSTVKNRTGAVAFVKFALGRKAAALGGRVGLQTIAHDVYGDKKAVPKGL
jgi:molybdate/tungstate transport system substrate-binding protein